MWNSYCVLGILALSPSVYSNSRPDQGAYTAVCRAYCDKNGHPRGGQLCQSYSRQVYCCGDLSTRYCCTRPEDAIQSQPEDVTTCPRSGGWWENNWQALLGLLGAIVALVAITTACYYCCIYVVPKNSSSARRSSMRITYNMRCDSVTTDYNVETRGRSFCFDPESPTAFDPPAYSLPTNPPSYMDSLPNAFRNLAFSMDDESGPSCSNDDRGRCVPVHDIISATGEPPPAYSNSIGRYRTTRRHSCAVPMVTIKNQNESGGKRRGSLGNESIGAIPPPPRFMRRRSTTCIAPNFNSSLPPDY